MRARLWKTPFVGARVTSSCRHIAPFDSKGGVEEDVRISALGIHTLGGRIPDHLCIVLLTGSGGIHNNLHDHTGILIRVRHP